MLSSNYALLRPLYSLKFFLSFKAKCKSELSFSHHPNENESLFLLGSHRFSIFQTLGQNVLVGHGINSVGHSQKEKRNRKYQSASYIVMVNITLGNFYFGCVCVCMHWIAVWNVKCLNNTGLEDYNVKHMHLHLYGHLSLGGLGLSSSLYSSCPTYYLLCTKKGGWLELLWRVKKELEEWRAGRLGRNLICELSIKFLFPLLWMLILICFQASITAPKNLCLVSVLWRCLPVTFNVPCGVV